ncbi:methionine--tRNA ligase [Thermodesulfobacteriota bacterium]
MGRTYYVTTPIYYVNDVPHIGHAYTTIAADVLARYKRLMGYDVHFLTGTDEHGLKVEKASRDAGMKPIELADKVVERFLRVWRRYDIRNDDFIRTTQVRHQAVVERVWKRLHESGDIYLGTYEDWYCTPCESFWTELQLQEGNCPECGRPTEKLKESSYFFRMSRYQDRLLEHLDAHPEFVRPESRYNEIVSFVRSGLKDLSISRTTFSWGIPVPDDPAHVIYVWLDALVNYISAIGCFTDDEAFTRWWPADVHIIGKDILRFHAVYWPTFLMAADLPLPGKIFAHGWWTIEGRKMSKSLGNMVDPLELADKYGIDAVRYFLLREAPFGSDCDLSRSAIVGRINSDLANDFGNLLSRSLGMLSKYFAGKVPATGDERSLDTGLREEGIRLVEVVGRQIDELAFNKALFSIWEYVSRVNKYIDESAPWSLAKSEDKRDRLATVMAQLFESLRLLSLMISPFMPGTAEKMWSQLGCGGELEAVNLSGGYRWNAMKPGTKIGKSVPLFPRIEEDMESEVKEEEKEGSDLIDMETFLKAEIRTARVLEAEPVPGSKKLLKLKVDAGEERAIVAGIGKVYRPEDLVGKTILVVFNLQPAKIMGVQSEGMLLAAGDDDDLSVATFDKETAPGLRVR